VTHERYIEIKNAELDQLQGQRAALLKNGSRIQSRWGYQVAFTDKTNWWLAELDRRIAELLRIVEIVRLHGLGAV
jgi:hypothetical protein